LAKIPYSGAVAAPKGLIGKLVKCRHAPRHCKKTIAVLAATAKAGRLWQALAVFESGDRPHGRVMCADIV